MDCLRHGEGGMANVVFASTKDPEEHGRGNTIDGEPLSWWGWCCPGLPRKFCCVLFTLTVLVTAVGGVALLLDSASADGAPTQNGDGDEEASSLPEPGWAFSLVLFGLFAMAFLGAIMLSCCPPAWLAPYLSTQADPRSGGEWEGHNGDIGGDLSQEVARMRGEGRPLE